MPLSQQTIFGSLAGESRKRPRDASSWKEATATRRRPTNQQSRFGICPLCEASFPWHKLEIHAASCAGKQATSDESLLGRSDTNDGETSNLETTPNGISPQNKSDKTQPLLPPKALKKPTDVQVFPANVNALPCITSIHDPDAPPGLFLYPDFITREEEDALIQMLDDPSAIPPWKMARFNGQHVGKRWGVHCNLRDRKVSAPEQELPVLLQKVVFSRLSQLDCWKRASIVAPFRPNEANAIDYRKQRGDWLQAHVDDRQLSKEPIANLSLAGTCIMTFANAKVAGQHPCQVTLPPRCLQVLTGPARYNYSHAIDNKDLLSDRRISITMRESPLTVLTDSKLRKTDENLPKIDRIFGKATS
mmetsp:Transcript_102111/g.295439  ORF Transcript_102111/g.295439 Transcript_102111/m.295439 type:complete len:361 (+) Transcript_102111:105-1187(+)